MFLLDVLALVCVLGVDFITCLFVGVVLALCFCFWVGYIVVCLLLGILLFLLLVLLFRFDFDIVLIVHFLCCLLYFSGYY